jgi:hypothetical protein
MRRYLRLLVLLNGDGSLGLGVQDTDTIQGGAQWLEHQAGGLSALGDVSRLVAEYLGGRRGSRYAHLLPLRDGGWRRCLSSVLVVCPDELMTDVHRSVSDVVGDIPIEGAPLEVALVQGITKARRRNVLEVGNGSIRPLVSGSTFDESAAVAHTAIAMYLGNTSMRMAVAMVQSGGVPWREMFRLEVLQKGQASHPAVRACGLQEALDATWEAVFLLNAANAERLARVLAMGLREWGLTYPSLRTILLAGPLAGSLVGAPSGAMAPLLPGVQIGVMQGLHDSVFRGAQWIKESSPGE